MTLHLWCQIVGKIALRSSSLRNHWWNATLRPTARGVATQRLRAGGTSFDIELDLVDHRAVVRADAHDDVTFRLYDGLCVAEFYELIVAALEAFGIAVPMVATPYGIAGQTTPFARDREHCSYDAVMVRRRWRVLRWSADVLERFATEFSGKQSPAQLFWHGLDLAMSRYSGRRAGGAVPADPVAREAYSHEVIAFGFWTGDPMVKAPACYTYTAPEPAALTEMILRPDGAQWSASGNGHLGTVSYELIRTADDPEGALLDFFRSGYDAGTRAAGWETSALCRTPR
jgi:hypothetical protein